MAKKLISFNFNGDFCKELRYLDKEYSTEELTVKNCTSMPGSFSSFKTETYLAEVLANYFGNINTFHLFVGRTTTGDYVAEYKKGDSTQICIGKMVDGEIQFKAGLVDDESILYAFDSGHKGTVFVSALLPLILEEEEAAGFADVLRNYPVDEEYYSLSMCGLTNNIYYRLKDGKSSQAVNYSCELQKMKQSDIEDIRIGKKYCGEPNVFSRDTGKMEEALLKKSGIRMTARMLKGKFSINKERVLTKEEQERVPDLGDWYVVPEWSVSTAKRICSSRRFRKSVQNIMFYGPSGSGKTEGSQAVAEMLNLPYYTHTFSPDDDSISTIGQLIPNVNKKHAAIEEVCFNLGIPTFDDVENDFKTSFQKLFGKEPGKADTAADCYSEITKRILAADTDDNDFVFVESEIIKAIKTGGVCEIQEANILKRASVLEALNPLLANDGKNSTIKLPTGEIIRRHPDCIIIFTINRDYDGCNNIQEAVYSRLNLIKQIKQPTATEMFERTKGETNFSNDALLQKMAKCVAEMHEYCKEKEISGGVCGPRELTDWAVLTILEAEEEELEKPDDNCAIKAAFESVLQKVAQDDDDMDDIIAGVFQKHFSPSKVNELRRC